jgi:hypothetical protein
MPSRTKTRVNAASRLCRSQPINLPASEARHPRQREHSIRRMAHRQRRSRWDLPKGERYGFRTPSPSRRSGAVRLRRMQACCTWPLKPPPSPPAPPRGLSPICRPSCLRRSIFAPASGLIRLTHSKRIRRVFSAIRARALDAVATRAIVVIICSQ